MKPLVDYRTCRHQIGSFAVLNCEHKRLFWRMIGHTAMVYRCVQTGALFVYESTQMSYSGVSGVQIHTLGEWLANYPGKVFIKTVAFQGADDAQRVQAGYALTDHIRHYRGTSYPDLKTRRGRWFLIKAAWDSLLFKKLSTNPDTEDAMFCTQLVAHAFRECGLAGGYVPSEFEPDDMRDNGKFWQYVKPELVQVAPEIRIK